MRMRDNRNNNNNNKLLKEKEELVVSFPFLHKLCQHDVNSGGESSVDMQKLNA